LNRAKSIIGNKVEPAIWSLPFLKEAKILIKVLLPIQKVLALQFYKD